MQTGKQPGLGSGRFILVLLVMLLVACGQQSPTTSPTTATTSITSTTSTIATTTTDSPSSPIQGEITVFAAASLTEAYTELGKTFETMHPGTSVTFNFANSQQLAQQLGQGAPADVFASANTKQMDIAIESGRIISGTQRIFAHNRLVAIVSNTSPIAVATLQDLATPNLKLILATPETPIGEYSAVFLEKAAQDETLGVAYAEAVQANVVSYEQTVKAVLTKVVLGEGDAGIVYTSDISADAANQLTTIAIPDALNTIAAYPLAPISDSANPATAQAFVDYLLAPDGQAIMTKYGFISPGAIPAAPIGQQTTPQPASANGDIVVFSVAPFADAFPRVGEVFDAANGTKTVFNFAGAPQLEQQMAQGANVDLFAYNEAHLLKAIETGRIISGTEQLIAHSRPIVVLPANNPAGIQALQDLATPGLKIVLGTEETAIGQHTLTFLTKAEEQKLFGVGYKDAVLANVVSYEPSVRAVLAKVLLGEADVAIVFSSDIAQDKDKVITLPLPETLSKTTNFYLAPVNDSANPAAAQAFIDYVLSPDGQALLTEYGFQPIE